MQSTGNIRLFDGLFVGDEHTARDQQFMLLNQITLVINLADQIASYFQHYKIRYLRLSMKEFAQQIDFFEEINVKINENFEREESVLIHGLSDLDEPVTLSAILIMNKFRWSLYKTLQYLQVRIRNLTFSAVSFNLLKAFQLKLLNSETRLSYNWQIRPEYLKELVLRNTFLNASKGQKKNKYMDSGIKKIKNAQRRVSWNIQKVTALTERSFSHKVDVQKLEEDSRRHRVILSVKKLISQSANKKNKINLDVNHKNNKNLSENAEKLKLDKFTAQDESYQPMKKYKSFYSLASLPSNQNLQTPLMYQRQKCQLYTLNQNLKKSSRQFNLKDRIKTQKSEKCIQTKNKLFDDKIYLMKTENTDYLNINQENILSSNSSQILSRKNSLVLKKQKQNISAITKISLRKPTPLKKHQQILKK